MGWLAVTRSPSMATIDMRRPAKSERTSAPLTVPSRSPTSMATSDAPAHPSAGVNSPAAGVFTPAADVTEGQHIERGRVVGHVAGHEVRSPFHGTVKGLLAVAGERLTRSQPVAWLRTA